MADDSEFLDLSTLIVAPGVTGADVQGRLITDDEMIDFHRRAMRYWVFDYVDILAKDSELEGMPEPARNRITANSGYAILLLTNFVVDLLGRMLMTEPGKPSERFEFGIKHVYPRLKHPDNAEGATLIYKILRNGLAHIGLPRNVVLNNESPAGLSWRRVAETEVDVLLVSPVKFAADIIAAYENFLASIQHPSTPLEYDMRKQALERMRTMS